MDGVYQELDKVKTEMEKLKEECRTKSDLSDSLKEAHSEQLCKLKEAKLQIQKQVQELNAKSEEISELRQQYEELRSSLLEKESSLRHLQSADEKVRVDCNKRIEILEGENKGLALALGEATTKTQDMELKVCAGNEEIEGLKRLLSYTQKKCLEAEEQAKASKDIQQRDATIFHMEEESRNIQDQLKWKNEQFDHLEEAHERLQDQFSSSKVEWEKEKSALVEEICKLQANLDSQTRITENLEIQLSMCNQALAHEESRRKFLEAEVSEFNSRFEHVSFEFEEAKSKMEELNLEREGEISKLRNLLGTKETYFKETEHRVAHLEQENEKLRESVKEFQEAQIVNAGATLLKNLQNKMRGLEQLHNKCSMNLKEKEFEWSERMNKMTQDMNGYRFKLKGKSKQILQLQKELEGYQFLLEVQNEEIFMVIMVLKSEFYATYSKLFSGRAEMELSNKEKDEEILLLTEQFEMKKSALDKVHANLEQKCEELAILMKRVESIDHIKRQQSLMNEELEKHKDMLAESSACQVCLKEQVLKLEKALKQEGKDFSDALEKANSELAKRTCDAEQAELDLEKWKATAEKLKIHIEESHQVLKGENDTLLGIVTDQEKNIVNLQQQSALLESTIAAKTEALRACEQDKEHYIQIAEDKNNRIESLQTEVANLKQQYATREMEGAFLIRSAQEGFEQEKERLSKIIKEKGQSLKDLEQTFKNAEYLKNIEIEEKNKTIVELEMEVNASCQKLECLEESFFHSKQQAEQLEALLQANKLEADKVKDQFENERRHLEVKVKELEFHKGALLKDISRLSSDREDLLIQMQGICEQISEFSGKDLELMGILGKILQTSEEENGPERVMNTQFSPSRKGNEEYIDNRSPLIELNH